MSLTRRQESGRENGPPCPADGRTDNGLGAEGQTDRRASGRMEVDNGDGGICGWEDERVWIRGMTRRYRARVSASGCRQVVGGRLYAVLLKTDSEWVMAPFKGLDVV